MTLDDLGNIGLALIGLASATLVFIKAVKPLTKLTAASWDDEVRDAAERILEDALKHVRGGK